MNSTKLVILTFGAVGALLFLQGCGSKATPQAEAGTPRNALEISPIADLQKQIQVGSPVWSSVASTIQVSGRIEADATRLARVGAPVTGRILELKAIEGQQVAKGELLATLYSTEPSTAQTDFLKASSERQLAERAVSRAKQLLDAGVIGSAELQRREAELQQAAADVSAARERLRILGVQDEAIDNLQKNRSLSSVTQIVASIDGIVLERKATIGQIVQAAEPVFVVADLSQVWLVADVPEQSAGNLTVGKAVEAEIPALPGRKLKGQLSFVSATVDPQTRTVATRMNVPNPHRLFKPAMLTTMTLVDGSARKLVIPSSAVVREGNQFCVFVETGDNKFLLRPVELEDDLGEKRVLKSGLREDERIVTVGAFHLNNERKRQALGEEGD